MIRNNKGQINLIAIVLLPIVLAVIGGLFILAIVLTTEAKAVAKCRLQMEQSQAEAAQHLNALLKLNPEAKRLKMQLRTAQRAFDAALLTGLPPAIAAAKGILLVVKIKRAALAAKQQKLIYKGRSASRDAPKLAEQSIRSALNGSRSGTISPSIAGPLGQPQSTRAGFFAVLPRPAGDIAPEYVPAPGFKYLQKTSLQWSIKMGRDDVFAKSLFDGNSDHADSDHIGPALPSFDIGCAITLVPSNQKETEWKPQIVEDKLLSN